MEELKTEQEFKVALMQCVRYMTKIGKSESVEMDLGKVTIELSLKTN